MTTALYDAFVSYAHEQKDLAAALQRGVERFAKPWWRSRVLRLYRDRTTMTATAEVLGTLDEALQASGKLVVILSPDAAASKWVNHEVGWWLKHKSAADLVLVLADGELKWGDGGWDLAVCTALPPALRGLKAEPRWIELRDAPPGSAEWAERVAEVVAALRNVAKDVLFGIARRESRRRVRHFGLMGGAGVVVLVAGLVAATLATERGELALAGRLAARSTALLATDLPPGPAPGRAGLPHGADRRDDRRAVPSGDRDPAGRGLSRRGREGDRGRAGAQRRRRRRGDGVGQRPSLVRRRADAHRPHRRPDHRGLGQRRRRHCVHDRRLAGAAMGERAAERRRPRRRPEAGPTAVSPSGHTALFNAVSTLDLSDAAPPASAIVTVDVPTRGYKAFALPGRWDELYAPTDGSIVAAGAGGGWWLRPGDGRADVAGSVYTGAHGEASTISADGRYFSFTNGSRQIPVWDTAPGEADTDRPQRVASVPEADRQALAISPNGRRLAASVAGTVYVTDIAAGPTATEPLALAGDTGVAALRFVGDNTLVGAAGNAVVTWDLARTSRISSGADGAVPSPCNGCPGVDVVVRPDGGAVALLGGGADALVVRYDGARPTATSFTTSGRAYIDDAVWSADDLVVAVSDQRRTVDAEIHAADGKLLGTWPMARGVDAGGLGLGRAVDGSVYDVDGLGRVLVREPATGRVLRTWPGPTVTPAEQHGTEAYAVAADGARAAIVSGGVVRLLELDSGRSTVLTTDATKVAFAASTLLVRFADGRLEIRAAADGALLHDLGPRPSTAWADMPSTNGQMIAEVLGDGSVRLADADTGAEIGTVPLDAAFERDKAGLAFTPDGATLVVAMPGSGPGSVLRWSVAPAGWIETACGLAGRDLTLDEWVAAGGSGHPDLRCVG